MTGRHEAPPLGSAARDATAPPYHGRHRAEDKPPNFDPAKDIDLMAVLRAERVADERWSDPEDTHQGSPDDV